MLNILRLGRPVQQSSLTPFSLSNTNHIKPKSPPSVLRFVQAASTSPSEMDAQKQKEPESKKQSDPQSKTTDTMSRDTMSSLGEGYAMRCDEEGFGGIYGGNQYLSKDDEDAHDFGHDQGSHVKETEKARNQK